MPSSGSYLDAGAARSDSYKLCIYNTLETLSSYPLFFGEAENGLGEMGTAKEVLSERYVPDGYRLSILPSVPSATL
jgi:hypothetical protein